MFRRYWLVSLCVTSLGLWGALLSLSGCGGGGGPINNPGGGNGGFSAQFVQLIQANAPAAVNATAVGPQTCLSCHNDVVHQGWVSTMHSQKGVGCENCHGFGSVHVANRRANVVAADVLTFPAVQEPLVCGQCHGPIFDQLMSSPHGQVVQEVIDDVHANVAVFGRNCTRCHAVALRNQFINVPWTHGLLEGKTIPQVQDEAEAAINALTDAQVLALADASHQTANCDTCHDPHTLTGMKTSEGDDLQIRRHTFNTDLSSVAPGAPTKVHSNWDQVCATCHNGRGADPSDAGLLASTARPNFHEGPQYNMLAGMTGALPPGAVIQHGTHFEAPNQCVHCHMPDDPATGQASHAFVPHLDVSCAPCHTAADAAAREAAVKDEVTSGLLVLRTRMEAWAQQKFGDPRFWDYYTLVSPDPAVQNQVKALQSQVPIEIMRARHNYYFILRDGSFGVHNAAYTRQLLAYSQSQLDALGIGRSVPLNRSVKSFQAVLKQDRLRLLLSLRAGQPGIP